MFRLKMVLSPDADDLMLGKRNELSFGEFSDHMYFVQRLTNCADVSTVLKTEEEKD